MLLCFRLENWQFEEWGSQVTVVSSDMREWVAPEKADIIVSELLGSFADNELSPECLDGAQHFLKGASRLGSIAEGEWIISWEGCSRVEGIGRDGSLGGGYKVLGKVGWTWVCALSK